MRRSFLWWIVNKALTFSKSPDDAVVSGRSVLLQAELLANSTVQGGGFIFCFFQRSLSSPPIVLRKHQQVCEPNPMKIEKSKETRIP